MKTILRLFSFTVFALLSANQSKSAEVSFSFFYDSLDQYGDWVEVGDYGYCWHPRDIDNDWRPYTTGNWAYTDAGWTWVSDEPYGWAVYHYGRWTRAERVGWIWVPDTEWAPAWVSWRRNDRYVGWAPLPPESRARIGVSLGRLVDLEFDIGPTFYSFVEVRHLGAPRLRSVVLPPRENITIINQTTNITNITYRNNIVINNGPDYDVVSRQVERPIRRLRLERRQEIGDLRAVRAEQLNAKVEGESLVVAAPAIQKAPEAKPKKVGQKIEKASVDRGWKDAGDAKQVETVRAKIKEEAKGVPAEAAPATAAQDRTPGAQPADATAQPKTERPPTAQESTEPKPGSETTTKPGRQKGKAAPGRRTAAEPSLPAKPGEPALPATEDKEPAKVGTSDQRDVAAEPDQPARTGKQRGKKGESRAKSPDAIAEDLKPPAEPKPDARPPQPDAAKTERPRNRQVPKDTDAAEQPARGPREDRSARPERSERPPEPARPQSRERVDRPARPERPEAAEQAERAVRERAQPPQAPQNRPPQPEAQRGGPKEGKARGPEDGQKKKKKGEPEPE
jgi:Family of unknown function (DUF6600)